jgi:hypothetical protein
MFQFDKLFHGCHALYGDEYRLIREKLLPGERPVYANNEYQCVLLSKSMLCYNVASILSTYFIFGQF